MRFQKQGPRECFPTSIAIVLGMPKDELIARVAVHPWEPYLLTHPNKRAMFCGIARECAPWLVPTIEEAYDLGRGASPEELRAHVESGASGIILLHLLWWSGHAVAYGDGLIYDPDADEPMTPNEWIAYCGRMIVSAYIATATP